MNKKKGTQLEQKVARLLSDHGFWARLDKGYAQTCDILAAKNNVMYLIEVKACKSDNFDLRRQEFNQSMSRLRFKECGNEHAYVVYGLDDGRMYISKDFISKPSTGGDFETWLTSQT